MSTEFCTNCGHKMEYNFAPPNFCSKCGHNIKGDAVSTASSPTPAASGPSLEQTIEEEVVPILDSLEYDISYAGSQVLKFEDLAVQAPASSKPKRARTKKMSKAAKEAVVQQSIESCKSVGNRSQEIGGKEKGK